MHGMATRINMADPNFVPINEQLRQLSQSTFADVAEQSQRNLEAIRQRIKAAQVALLKTSRVQEPQACLVGDCLTKRLGQNDRHCQTSL
jgi:hypothetical protein